MANDLSWTKELRDQAFPDTSTAVLAHKSGAWMLYAMLLGHIGAATDWVLAGSSDAVTAGLDTTDRLGSTWDASKWVRAAAGTAHTWFVLRSPTLGVYLCLDLSGTSDNYPSSITWAKTAFTGGSVTARPTSTDEVAIYTAAATFVLAVDATPHRAHIVVSSSGDFHFLVSKNGLNAPNVWFSICKLMNPKTLDQYPWISIWQVNTGATGVLTTAALSANLSQRCRHYTGGAVSVVASGILSTQAGTLLAAWPAGGDVVDHTYPDLPVTAWITDANMQSAKGRWPDLGFAPATLANGTPEDATPCARIKLDGCWVPFTVAPTL